jgi:uncharacterized protein (TIGR03118 family)
VTYAKQNSAKTGADDNCGDNCGFVDIFTAKGKLLQRLENGPWLRAPWGVALAPQDFGFFSHDLLIGNRFGGTIAAFDVVSGKFLGNLARCERRTHCDRRAVGNRVRQSRRQRSRARRQLLRKVMLFIFAAGIDNYAHGLFGTFTPVAAQLNAEDHE